VPAGGGAGSVATASCFGDDAAAPSVVSFVAVRAAVGDVGTVTLAAVWRSDHTPADIPIAVPTSVAMTAF